jgi:tetratricopeptide (TPR) repeat protein
VKAAFVETLGQCVHRGLILGVCFLLAVACSRSVKRSAYQAELDDIATDLSSVERAPDDAEKGTKKLGKLAYLWFRKASLTGDHNDFRAAGEAIDRALQGPGPLEDLYLLKAKLDFRWHRIPQTRQNLEKAPSAAGTLVYEALQADLAFQEGRYDDARNSYEALVQRHRTWDSFARLAYHTFVMGDVVKADELYRRAQDQITTREMGSYAWVELQRGFLEFNRGRFDAALAHYQRAEEAYPGWWSVQEYVAEVLGAQGRFKEAEAIYKKLIAHSPRPEFHDALGDLYLFMQDPERARPWHDKALAGYLESVQQGNLHYFHHLAGFYADVRPDGREAVRWARQDIEVRDNFLTQDALAWALYRNNQFAEALAAIERALSSRVQDAHIFDHAAQIYRATGKSEEAERFLQQAAEINPSYHAFHVHH